MSGWKRNRLYILRVSKRLTQHDVAEQLGVSQATYWKYETGIAEPDDDTKKALAKVLGVKVADLLEKAS